jgi:purine-binding chemotaxis protein CheW
MSLHGKQQRHDPSKNLVGFVVGDVQYAVPIARVREIANPLEVVALPHAPRAVCGVADYRGEVVPVVELRERFGLPPSLRTRKTKWIVIDVGARVADVMEGASHRVVAIVVDAVTDVFGTGGAELRPAPSLGGGDDVRGIAGVTHREGTLVFVLDTSRLRELTDPLAAAGAIGAGAAAHPLPAKASP